MANMNQIIRALAGRVRPQEQTEQTPRPVTSNAGSGTDSVGSLPRTFDMNKAIRAIAKGWKL